MYSSSAVGSSMNQGLISALDICENLQIINGMRDIPNWLASVMNTFPVQPRVLPFNATRTRGFLYLR